MIGTFYVFERMSADSRLSCSLAAEKILHSATRNTSGIRFYELTEHTNPRPLFVVLFASEMIRTYFEGMIQHLTENSGLRIEITQPAPQVASQERQSQFSGTAANSARIDRSRVDDEMRTIVANRRLIFCNGG